MDRIRNARHFASRLQRWLDGIGATAQEPTLRQHMASLQVNQGFAHDDVTAAVTAAPSAVPIPPRPAPPTGAPAWQAAPPPSSAPPFAPPVPPALSPAASPSAAIPLAIVPAPVSSPAGPPRAPDAPPLRQLQLGAHQLDYVLRRSTRRSIGFMIDDDGLRVTAPKRVTLAEIDNAIRAKQGWILSKLNERRERRAQRLQRPPVAWIDGAALPYLGGEITLRLHQAARPRARFDRDSGELHVWQAPAGSEQQLQEKVRAWLQQEARRLFAERLDLYAARLGVSYAAFALSSAGTRWGSCTAQRTIRLNWRLIHFALPLIDYVVAHELSHLLEMNHSARFWATVATVYPDYDGAKLALRKRSQELPQLFQ